MFFFLEIFQINDVLGLPVEFSGILAKGTRKGLITENVHEQNRSGTAGTPGKELQNKMNVQCNYLKFSR